MDFNFTAESRGKNMKVNMNIIVGGTDHMLDDILSVARTVRKEMKNSLAEIYQNIILNREFIRQDIVLKPRILWYMFILALMSGVPIRKKV